MPVRAQCLLLQSALFASMDWCRPPPAHAWASFHIYLVNCHYLSRFSETLESGEKRLNEALWSAKAGGRPLSGAEAFNLYDTYGFPLEITQELASMHGILVCLTILCCHVSSVWLSIKMDLSNWQDLYSLPAMSFWPACNSPVPHYFTSWPACVRNQTSSELPQYLK